MTTSTSSSTPTVPVARTSQPDWEAVNPAPKPGQKIIQFYNQNKEFGEFSNFWSKNPIDFEGKTWATSEHYFQAKKFEGTKYEEEVRLTESAAESAKMGRRRDLPLRKDWESVKEEIMYKICFVKFTQAASLRRVLLSTEDAYLIEHTKNDSYWGDAGDKEPLGTGKNRLGYVLMKVRDDIKKLGSNSK